MDIVGAGGRRRGCARTVEKDADTGCGIVGGVSAAVSKTAAAPIERVKLLVQNQVRLSARLSGAHRR